MRENRKLLMYSHFFSGILILLWGLLHVFIISVIKEELNAKSVNDGIISLITLSYVGIVIMISLSGIILMATALTGIKRGEKWAYFINFSQGLLYCFVTILLGILQPKVAVMGFSADFILIIAIGMDLTISILILIPLLIWKGDFFGKK